MLPSDHGDPRPPAADLVVVVVAAVGLAVLALAPGGPWRPLAIVFGVPAVLLAPGYALVAATFPRAGETAPVAGQLSWTARLVLSVPGSVVAIAIVAIALDFSIWGFQQTAVVGGCAGFTVLAAGLAWVRRRPLPPEDAAGVSAAGVRARTRALAVGDGPRHALLTLLVLAAAVGAVGVVAEESASTGTVTEFYVLGQTATGEFVAGSYPDTLTAGTPTTVGIGVGTTRAGGFEGTVVATLERVAVDGTDVRVTRSQRLGTFDIAVPAGERTVRRHTVQPSLVGDDLRLTYRLYERDADTPFRRVQFWVSVTSAN